MHPPIPGRRRPNLPVGRVAAYHRVESTAGIRKEKRVTGWYGTFNEDRLISEFIPKVSDIVALGEVSYPILITSYELKAETLFRFESGGKHDRRTRNSPEIYEAVIRSGTEHLIL